jgi:hypothetical protein
MKTTKRVTKKATAMVACASLMMLTLGAWTAFAAGATLQETEAVWGSPVGIQRLDSGAEKRFYKYTNTMNVGFRYFVYQDGRVIEDGLANLAPEVKKASKEGQPASELSKAYYRNNPITAQEEDQLWGKPVAVRTLEDGTEERYYKYDNTANLGFRYFQVKEGKVVASGLSKVTGVEEKKGELKGVRVPFVKDSGTQTVADVESTWGKPVGVKKLSNGLEERYYKIDNTMNIGSRMFLFKDGKAIGTTVATF